MTQSSIQEQVRLPARVAFQVVLQGMRIRFGRSMVTIMGVVLGIAFLMSVLSSQVLRAGVAGEQDARMEVSRMMNFLQAEIGPPGGKTISLLQTGPLNDLELRLVERLVEAKVGSLRWLELEDSGDADVIGRMVGGLREDVDPAVLAEDSRFVLIMGDGLPSSSALQAVFHEGVDVPAGLTRTSSGQALPSEIKTVTLAQKLRPDEIERKEKKARIAKYRNTWITIISLLVTVIGITNAMLMSVTERFREIGTMKCLGALSSFIRQIFLFESCLIGAVGGLAGSLVGAVFSILIYALTYGFGVVGITVVHSAGVLLLDVFLAFAAGVILSMIAAIYPAGVASRMVPADALRSNV